MYAKKAPKREKLDTGPYTIMKYDMRPQIQWTDNYYQVLSIDPATDTYAFRIEKRWLNGYIETLAFERAKFKKDLDENSNCHLYMEISQFLDQYFYLYADCHFFLVERQMVPNYKAIRVAQHTFSYLMNIARSSAKVPIIMEVDPKLKNKLGAPSGLSYSFLKKWNVSKSKEYLVQRGDYQSIAKIESFGKKQDDMADTIMIIEGVMKHLGLPLTPDILVTGPPSNKPTLRIL